MTTTRIAKQALAAMFMAVIATLMLGGTALATTVQGADYHATGSSLEQGEVDVLNVAGNKNDTVFVSVTMNGRDVAKYMPYTLGADGSESNGSSWAGVVTLDLGSVDASTLNGNYGVKAYSSRSGGDPLYEGALYGVYAQPESKDGKLGDKVLIGIRTVGSKDSARSFVPLDSLYVNGATYKLVGDANDEGNVLTFAYKEYDEATTVDGVIKFVDSAGKVVASQKVPGLEFEKAQDVKVPQVVTGDDGAVYRTVFFKDSVTMKNPGQTSSTVYCTQMSAADQAANNYYVAAIQLVDQDGRVIATDSVNVTGEYYYTAPTTIYKNMVDGNGDTTVAEYRIAGSDSIRFNPATDGVFTGTRLVTIPYEQVDNQQAETTVTFNLADGSKRFSDKARSLGTVTKTVDAENPVATPEETIEVNGATFHLAGSADNYAYEYGSKVMPSVDVYYLPEGYQAPGAYDVTVNYVNFSTNQVVGSQTVQSSPDDLGAIQIEVPETFQADGVDYVRLAGQGSTIEHSYYSGKATYTVYYRDVNDTLTSGTVINTIRVVYEDGTEGTVATGGAEGTEAGTEAGAAGTEGTEAGAAGTGAEGAGAEGGTTAPAEGTEVLRLNNGRTYNVFDGEGNSTITNEAGVDSNTERIEDDTNPLAAGLYNQDPEGSLAQAIGQNAGIVIVVALVAGAALVGYLLMRRRNDDKNNAKAEA